MGKLAISTGIQSLRGIIGAPSLDYGTNSSTYPRNYEFIRAKRFLTVAKDGVFVAEREIFRLGKTISNGDVYANTSLFYRVSRTKLLVRDVVSPRVESTIEITIGTVTMDAQ